MDNVANFDSDNRWSQQVSTAPFWGAIFSKTFPGYTGHTVVSGGNTWAQSGGVDFIVTTTHGQTYSIDQKARREVYFCSKCFPGSARQESEERCLEIIKGVNLKCEWCGGHSVSDILLEVTSNDRTGTPGWARKPLLCEFVAYVFVPIRRCYMLPLVPLQRAWARFGEEWTTAYGTRAARNRGYNTINVPVPVPVLLRAMSKSMVVLWDSADVKKLQQAGVAA